MKLRSKLFVLLSFVALFGMVATTSFSVRAQTTTLFLQQETASPTPTPVMPLISIPRAMGTRTINLVTSTRTFTAEVQVVTLNVTSDLQVAGGLLTRIDGSGDSPQLAARSSADPKNPTPIGPRRFWIVTLSGELPDRAQYTGTLVLYYNNGNASEEYTVNVTYQAPPQFAFAEESSGRIALQVTGSEFVRVLTLSAPSQRSTIGDLEITVEPLRLQDDRQSETEQLTLGLGPFSVTAPGSLPAQTVRPGDDLMLQVSGHGFRQGAYVTAIRLVYQETDRVIPVDISVNLPAPTATPRALQLSEVGVVSGDFFGSLENFLLGGYPEVSVDVHELTNQPRNIYPPHLGLLRRQTENNEYVNMTSPMTKLFVKDDSGTFIDISKFLTPLPSGTAATTTATVTMTSNATATATRESATPEATVSITAAANGAVSLAGSTLMVYQPTQASTDEATSTGTVVANVSATATPAPASTNAQPATTTSTPPVVLGGTTMMISANAPRTFKYQMHNLPAGSYTGQIIVGSPDGAREAIDFNLVVRHGCILPILVIAIGVLFATLMRETNAGGRARIDRARAVLTEKKKFRVTYNYVRKNNSDPVWAGLYAELEDLEEENKAGSNPDAFTATLADVRQRGAIYNSAIVLHGQIRQQLEQYPDVDTALQKRAEFQQLLEGLLRSVRSVLQTPAADRIAKAENLRSQLVDLYTKVRATSIQILAAYLVRQLDDLIARTPEWETQANLIKGRVSPYATAQPAEGELDIAAETIQQQYHSYLALRLDQVRKLMNDLLLDISGDSPKFRTVQLAPLTTVPPQTPGQNGAGAPADVWAEVRRHLEQIRLELLSAKQVMENPIGRLNDVLKHLDEARYAYLRAQVELLLVVAQGRAWPEELTREEWLESLRFAPNLNANLQAARQYFGDPQGFSQVLKSYEAARVEYFKALVHELRKRITDFLSFIARASAHLIKAPDGVSSELEQKLSQTSTDLTNMRSDLGANPAETNFESKRLAFAQVRLNVLQALVEWVDLNFANNVEAQDRLAEVPIGRATEKVALAATMRGRQRAQAMSQAEQLLSDCQTEWEQLVSDIPAPGPLPDDSEEKADLMGDVAALDAAIPTLPAGGSTAPTPGDTTATIDTGERFGAGLFSILLSVAGTQDEDPGKALGRLSGVRMLLDTSLVVVGLVVATLTGFATLYLSNPTFGSLLDYVTAFLWGFVAQQLISAVAPSSTGKKPTT